jgi:transketolase
MGQKTDRELEILAGEIRIAALETLGAFGSGHVGGAMSVVETLAALYGGELRHDPANPDWEERDRLVLSKGHAGPALYAALAVRGYFPRELLLTLNEGGTILPSHVDRTKTPGVDMTCGSLGQGMSAAVGIALGSRLNKWDATTYLILGDGECDEGQVWEGAMFAYHNRLANLIAFVDCNKQQLDGYTKDVLDTGDMAEKFRSFGWNVIEVGGNDAGAVRAAIQAAKAEKLLPTAIILDTIKGYCCTFAEGKANNHSMTCGKEDVAAAIAAIREKIGA